MIGLDLKLEPSEPVWPREEGDVVRFADEASLVDVAVLPRGMASGRPSVAIRLHLEDGSTVIAQTSARLFVTAARAIHARYPDLLEGP